METPYSSGPGAGSAPPPPPVGAQGPRQLRRRPDQGPIAGVCAGVAEYFNVDPVIVRIAAVVLLISGPGLFAYVLAWIFVPEAEGGAALSGQAAAGNGTDHGKQIFGIVLLVIAVSVLWGDWWAPGRRWLLPLGLMALGAWLLLRRRDDDSSMPPPAGPAGGPTMPPPPPPPTWSPQDPIVTAPVASDDRPSHGVEPGAIGGSDPAVQDPTIEGASLDGTDVTQRWDAAAPTASGEVGDGGPAAPAQPFPWGGPPPAPGESPEARRRRRMLGPMVMGALLVWAGAAWVIGVSLESALAIGLCIVGLGFVLGAFVGGSWALVVPAFVIGTALIVATVVDIPLGGPVGDRTWTPRAISEVEDRYELSMGEGTLDLTQLDLGAGDHLDIEASVGMGHLVIRVPADAEVRAEGDVSVGETFLLGVRNSGVSVSDEQRTEGDRSAGSIDLDLQVGIGQIEVVTVG